MSSESGKLFDFGDPSDNLTDKSLAMDWTILRSSSISVFICPISSDICFKSVCLLATSFVDSVPAGVND